MFFFKSDKMTLTPDTRSFVEDMEGGDTPPLSSLSPEQARKVLRTVQERPAPLLPVRVQDVELSVGPTGSVPVRVVRPDGVEGALPFILYVHGGGWVMGDRHTHDRLIRELAAGAQAAVVFPEYTPSPEARYPVALEQIYAVLTHMADNAAQYDLEASHAAVAGDSAGANMAAAAALMSRERGGPRLALQALLYPVMSAEGGSASYKTFADGPWLTRKSMEWFWNAYCPDETRREEILVSPLKAEPERLQGLPPALVITAENDVLRDEGEAYARKLMEAGVEVTAVRYLGTIHDFMMLNALAGTAPARSAVRQTCEMLMRTLHV